MTYFDLQAQIRVIPAAHVVTVGEATPIPWWAIFVPILVAVIVITVVAVLLWVVSSLQKDCATLLIFVLFGQFSMIVVARIPILYTCM